MVNFREPDEKAIQDALEKMVRDVGVPQEEAFRAKISSAVTLEGLDQEALNNVSKDREQRAKALDEKLPQDTDPDKKPSPGEILQQELERKAKSLGVDVTYLERTAKEQGVDTLAVNSEHVNQQKEKDSEEIRKATAAAMSLVVGTGAAIAFAGNQPHSSLGALASPNPQNAQQHGSNEPQLG